MLVAVCVFKGSVSPRLDVSDTLLIYLIDNGDVKGSESHSPVCDHPMQLISFLREKNVETVIVGGCPRFFLRMLIHHGVNVVYGVRGEPDAVLTMFLQGKLERNPETTCTRGTCCDKQKGYPKTVANRKHVAKRRLKKCVKNHNMTKM
jgi:predicted Fe-Mo cluster-binding NifX family protein